MDIKSGLKNWLENTDGDPMNDSRLPDSYDELVSTDRLRRGEHNVRNARPSDQLIQSIERSGIATALVTRPTPHDGNDLLYITDGWQRYQAAVELGWSQVPVNVYDDVIEALENAELQSIVDEWTTYQAATHVNQLYQELPTDGGQEDETVSLIADRTARSEQTVRRYLDAFKLPDTLRNLLKNRGNITDSEWKSADNFYREATDNIRDCNGTPLSWRVAAKAGRRRQDFEDPDRFLRAVTATTDFTADKGYRLIDEMADDHELTVPGAVNRLFDNGSYENERYFKIPRTGMTLEPEKKRAIMEYTDRNRIPTSSVAEKQMREFIDQLVDPNKTLDEYDD
jgi:hypothetical protein